MQCINGQPQLVQLHKNAIHFHFQAEFDTWKSELNIESALNADYTKYECRAENELGEDKFNISLVPPR